MRYFIIPWTAFKPSSNPWRKVKSLKKKKGIHKFPHCGCLKRSEGMVELRPHNNLNSHSISTLLGIIEKEKTIWKLWKKGKTIWKLKRKETIWEYLNKSFSISPRLALSLSLVACAFRGVLVSNLKWTYQKYCTSSTSTSSSITISISTTRSISSTIRKDEVKSR